MKSPVAAAMTEISDVRCQRPGVSDICNSRRVSFRISIFVILAAALGASAMAQSRRDASGMAPPPVVTGTVQVKRGEKVVVPLGIHGTRGGKLDFIIRTPPARGRLSAVKSTGLSSATVTYTAPSRGSYAEDRFAYAVRSSEGVSAPGVVTIRFVDPPVLPPSLRVPGELEFPAVFPGQSSLLEMELVNEGGGVIEGDVVVPEPWAVEGIKFFRLRGGQRTTIRLAFQSDKPGVSTGEAIITGMDRRIVPLRATVEERLAATPPQLKLTAKPGSQTRTGSIRLSNRSNEVASVTVAASARLITDRVVTVPARGTVALPVFADAEQSGAFDEVVKLTSDGWAATVAVHAVPVGAILKFAGDKVSIVGTAGGISASGSATLENSGGESVTVRLDIEPPFELETTVVMVPGRGRLEIPIRAPHAGPGSYRATLKTAGEGVPAVVEITAELAPQTTAVIPATVRPTQEAAKLEERPDASAAQDTSLPWMPATAQEIPNALGKFARQIGTDFVILDWPSSLGVAADVRLVERVLSLSTDGELQVEWAPVRNVRVAAGSDRVTAEIRDLKPASLYTIRAVSESGADPATLFTTEFWTLPKKPLFNFGWRTPALVMALAALALSIWRSRRMPKK